MSNVSRVEFRPTYRKLRSEILAAVDRVFTSGTLILGPEVKAFENAMVQMLGPSGRAIGVGSGTDAITVALRALGIGEGDEVLTVSNTAVGSVNGIRTIRATPVFCDIHPETLMMDCGDARRRITPRTRAILPVHLFGNAVDMSEVMALAKNYELKVIEDCAQALGTLYRGQPVGTFGDVGCFSFYPTKNLGAYGDGGLCYTHDAYLAETMRQVRVCGCDGRGHARRAGFNSRLDEVQAAILQVKLGHFAEDLDARRRVAELYGRGLADRWGRVATTEGVLHSYCLYVIRVPTRDGILDRMAGASIECGVHYPLPVHLMDAFQSPACGRGSLPHTERSATEVLSLPCYPHISDAAVDRVIKVLNDAA